VNKSLIVMNRFFDRTVTFREIVFVLAIALCATPWVNAPMALVAGFLVSYFVGHPFIHLNHKATNWLLKISVVGLGFGMNASTAFHASKDGMEMTIFSILITLVLGALIGRLLHVNKKTSHLVASGTAICGGSAIAAVAPVVNASEKEMSVSLATVFTLNSIALLVFPIIGHWFSLSQHQFGVWSAIAIHDTSSVVGAASAYGQEALETATTIKLARALWIIPVTIVSAFLFKAKNKKISIPWFIGFFLLAMLFNTFLPAAESVTSTLAMLSKHGLVITLFLIGAGLSVDKIKSVGWQPMVLGVILWVVISVASFTVVRFL
jgi:uncharacterized integral membrane protein (TIGR00698 family)